MIDTIFYTKKTSIVRENYDFFTSSIYDYEILCQFFLIFSNDFRI